VSIYPNLSARSSVFINSKVERARSPFRSFGIDNLLDVIKQSVDQVRGCSGRRRDEFIVGTYQGVQSITKTAQATLVEARDISRDVSDVVNGVAGLKEQCHEIDSRIVDLFEQQQFMYRQMKDAMSSQTGLFQLLRDEFLSE
jgi:hypothetical protein